MNECGLQEYLSPYLDGELDPELRKQVEAHLQTCPACDEQLQILRDVSSRIALAHFEDVNSRALDRMHHAIDQAAADDARGLQIWRTAGFFTALAASVLIVAGVWLWQLPPAAPRGTVAGRPQHALAPDWERVAIDLRAEPRPGLLDDSPLSPHYAAAIDWMLSSLVPTERKSWVKPNSL